MNKEEVYINLNKTPYLCTTGYLFDQFIMLGYDKNEKKKEIIPQVQASIIQMQNTLKDKLNSLEECIISISPSLLFTISSQVDNQLLCTNTILQTIFPNTPKVYYQVEDQRIDDNNNNLQQKNIIFVCNADNEKGSSKNVINGYAFLFYEKIKVKISCLNQANEQTLRIYIPKVFCIISHYPFFSHYATFAQNILDLFTSKKLEIPIEIILYNIINFTPAPINKNIDFTYLQNAQIQLKKTKKHHSPHKDYIIKDSSTTDKSLFFNCLSGYPLCDFNLSELFNIFPLEHIIEILIFSFLEIDILFFSENFEILNIIMYIFSVLNYPCNDTSYLWHNVSISKEALIDNDKGGNFIGKPFSSMLGVNCSYDSNFSLKKFSKSLFVVDIDKTELFYSYLESELSKKEIEECQEISQLYNYIETKILNRDSAGNPFEENLKKLIDEIVRVSTKAENYNANGRKDGYDFFTQINHHFNGKIQSIFYTFILNLIKQFTASDLFDNQQEKNISDEKKLSIEENIFNRLFTESSKYSNYFISFFKNNKQLDCYQVPLYFSEEFLQLKHKIEEEYTFQHLAIIDNLFLKDIQTLIINFNEFYLFYFEVLSPIIYSEIYKSHLIQTKNKGKGRFVYSYNRTELDDKLLFKYMHFLSNLNNEELQKLFFSSSMLQMSNVIPTITYSEILNPIEGYYLKNKTFGLIDLISFSIILFYTFTSMSQNENEFIQQFKIVYLLLKQQKYFLRKYFFLLILVYYHHLILLREKNKEYIHIVFAYKQLKKLISFKKLHLNQELFKLIKLFDSIPEIEKDNNSTSLNEFENELYLKQTCDKLKNDSYSIELMNNVCKDNSFEEKYIIKIAENLDYEGDIKIICDICEKTIHPQLNLINIEKSIKSELFSPLKIYSICKLIMENWLLVKMKNEALDKKLLKKLMINLLFYQQTIPKLQLSSVMVLLFSFSPK